MYIYIRIEERQNDMEVYRESDLDSLLKNGLHINEEQKLAYCDAGFVRKPCLQLGFPSGVADPLKELFNVTLS